MSPKARAHVVHHLPGRVRFRVPGRRGDHGFFAQVAGDLEALRGVRQVDTNPATGSILIRHDGPVHELLAQAVGSPLASLLELELSAPPVAGRLRTTAERADGALRRLTNGEFDLATAASLGLIAFAGIQLVRRRPFGTVVPLVWYASELLTRWRPGARG